jgi:hypothetical protein
MTPAARGKLLPYQMFPQPHHARKQFFAFRDRAITATKWNRSDRFTILSVVGTGLRGSANLAKRHIRFAILLCGRKLCYQLTNQPLEPASAAPYWLGRSSKALDTRSSEGFDSRTDFT